MGNRSREDERADKAERELVFAKDELRIAHNRSADVMAERDTAEGERDAARAELAVARAELAVARAEVLRLAQEIKAADAALAEAPLYGHASLSHASLADAIRHYRRVVEARLAGGTDDA